MGVIKWLVSLVPQSVRAFFACLLITIIVLCGVIVYQDKTQSSDRAAYERNTKSLTDDCNKQVDSLIQRIQIVQEQSKQEAIKTLERIISEQKQTIRKQSIQRKYQDRSKATNNSIILENSIKIENLQKLN